MSSRPVAVGPVLGPALADALHQYFVHADVQQLLAQLRVLMPIPFSGVVLYGSLARRPLPAEIGDSDVDLLLLTDEPAHGGIFGFAQEVQVDLHVQTRAATLADLASNWVYADARILWDARPPELLQWQSTLRAWKSAHRPEWNEVDRLRNQVWAERLIRRLEKLAPVDEGKAWLLSSRLIAAIPQFHAHVRGMHTTSFSQWWGALAVSDPLLHDRLDQYLCARQLRPQTLREIFALIFEAPVPCDPGQSVPMP